MLMSAAARRDHQHHQQQQEKEREQQSLRMSSTSLLCFNHLRDSLRLYQQKDIIVKHQQQRKYMIPSFQLQRLVQRATSSLYIFSSACKNKTKTIMNASVGGQEEEEGQYRSQQHHHQQEDNLRRQQQPRYQHIKKSTVALQTVSKDNFSTSSSILE